MSTGAPPDRAVHAGTAHAGAVHVQGRACRSRAGLFSEWAARLSLPEYFGRNWDALADSLADLVAEAPLTVVVDDAVHLLADEPQAQLRTLLAVLRGVATREPDRLVVLLRCAPADEPALRQRITSAAPPP
nr:barstar family protein [Planosporangium thailandense]